MEKGSDARLIAVPPEGSFKYGGDRRKIAVPKGWTTTAGPDGRMVTIPPGGEFIVGTDQFATVLPPDNFDVTDYVTRYCILGPQTDTPIEEDKEDAALRLAAGHVILWGGIRCRRGEDCVPPPRTSHGKKFRSLSVLKSQRTSIV